MPSFRGRLSRLGFLLAVSATPAAHANDATFGGTGADLVPLEQTQVRMLSEDIALEYRAAKWQVTAVYVFENQGKAPVQLQVGFPERRCPEDPETDCSRARFEGLVTVVNGKPVKQRTGQVSRKHEWARHVDTVWLFDAKFAAGAKTEVRHSYSIASGQDVSGNSFTTYVTRTGAKWAGTIGRATFTLTLPLATNRLSGSNIDLKQAELVDPDSPSPWVRAVFEQTNWEPTKDLSFSFNDTPPGRISGGEDDCPEPHAPKTPREWQACKNLIYAIHGYPFKKPELHRLFYGAAPGSTSFYETKQEDGTKLWQRALRELPAFQTAWITASNAAHLRWLEQNPPVGANSAEAPVASPSAAPPPVAPPSAAPPPVASSSPRTEPVVAAARADAKCGCAVPARQGQTLNVLLLALSGFALRRRFRAPRKTCQDLKDRRPSRPLATTTPDRRMR